MTRSAAAVAAQPSLVHQPGRTVRLKKNSSGASPKRPARRTSARRGEGLNPPAIVDSIAAHRLPGRDVRTGQTGTEAHPPRGIAHDFNNLLGVITLNLELAREQAACGGELRKLIDEALDAAWQGSELTSLIAGSARHRGA